MSYNIFNFARLKQRAWRVISPCVNRIRYSTLSNRDESDRIRQLTTRLESAPPIFVFQMGKVASTSIYRMLCNSNYPGAISHAHHFDAFHPDLEVRTLFRFYKANHPNIKVISLVREPISRNVSAFFQNLKRDSGQQIEKHSFSVVDLKKRFLNNYPHEIPLIWFDRNIKKHFGIDVYEYEFPETGHVTIRNGNIDLLVMRHDLPNELKQELVANFTQIEDLKISNENVAQDKAYSRLYEEFKEARLPLSHLHYLASSKYMKHFFFPEMRQTLMAWSEEPLPGTQVA